MPTIVRGIDPFDRKLRRLAKKYPKVIDTVEKLITDLENDARPGDKIPNVGYDVYKVRLENLSANRGKSGGFRVIYYVRLADKVFLLTIYSKTEETDMPLNDIRAAIEAAHTAENNDSTQ
jgi:mRNA-degrading endonuclease RelE of RelBE toxin-antitoxin system